MIDGKQLHKGWEQWNENTVLDWFNQLDNHPANKISIGGFYCTSSHVVNSVYDFLGRTIDPERGRRYLIIEEDMDNKLEAWPLE